MSDSPIEVQYDDNQSSESLYDPECVIIPRTESITGIGAPLRDLRRMIDSPIEVQYDDNQSSESLYDPECVIIPRTESITGIGAPLRDLRRLFKKKHFFSLFQSVLIQFDGINIEYICLAQKFKDIFQTDAIPRVVEILCTTTENDIISKKFEIKKQQFDGWYRCVFPVANVKSILISPKTAFDGSDKCGLSSIMFIQQKTKDGFMPLVPTSPPILRDCDCEVDAPRRKGSGCEFLYLYEDKDVSGIGEIEHASSLQNVSSRDVLQIHTLRIDMHGKSIDYVYFRLILKKSLDLLIKNLDIRVEDSDGQIHLFRFSVEYPHRRWNRAYIGLDSVKCFEIGNITTFGGDHEALISCLKLQVQKKDATPIHILQGKSQTPSQAKLRKIVIESEKAKKAKVGRYLRESLVHAQKEIDRAIETETVDREEGDNQEQGRRRVPTNSILDLTSSGEGIAAQRPTSSSEGKVIRKYGIGGMGLPLCIFLPTSYIDLYNGAGSPLIRLRHLLSCKSLLIYFTCCYIRFSQPVDIKTLLFRNASNRIVWNTPRNFSMRVSYSDDRGNPCVVTLRYDGLVDPIRGRWYLYDIRIRNITEIQIFIKDNWDGDAYAVLSGIKFEEMEPISGKKYLGILGKKRPRRSVSEIKMLKDLDVRWRKGEGRTEDEIRPFHQIQEKGNRTVYCGKTGKIIKTSSPSESLPEKKGKQHTVLESERKGYNTSAVSTFHSSKSDQVSGTQSKSKR
ncbi:hypothetical protein ADUPG1_000587, partial [Aduncisulcus paluster]